MVARYQIHCWWYGSDLLKQVVGYILKKSDDAVHEVK
jgi:hypothetical protein